MAFGASSASLAPDRPTDGRIPGTPEFRGHHIEFRALPPHNQEWYRLTLRPPLGVEFLELGNAHSLIAV